MNEQHLLVEALDNSDSGYMHYPNQSPPSDNFGFSNPEGHALAERLASKFHNLQIHFLEGIQELKREMQRCGSMNIEIESGELQDVILKAIVKFDY
jgi:hypothetical protein